MPAKDEDWDTLDELVEEIYGDKSFKTLDSLCQDCIDYEVFDDKNKTNNKKILKGVLAVERDSVSKDAFTSFVFAFGASDESAEFPIQRNVMKYAWDKEKEEVYNWFHPDCSKDEAAERLRERAKGSYLVRYCELKKVRQAGSVLALTRSSMQGGGDDKRLKIAHSRIQNSYDGFLRNLETGKELPSLLDVVSIKKLLENGGVPRSATDVLRRKVSEAYSPTPKYTTDEPPQDAYTPTPQATEEASYGVNLTADVGASDNYAGQEICGQSTASENNYTQFQDNPTSPASENAYGVTEDAYGQPIQEQPPATDNYSKFNEVAIESNEPKEGAYATFN